MTFKHHCGPGRRGYHHGNLREALIESALQLIAEKGPSGFTVAEAARVAGVSPAAPYRHFHDRDDLMAEIAKQGFQRFADSLERGWNGGQPTPLEALNNIGIAYLEFARTMPAYYEAMFGSGLPKNATPDLEQAAEKAFNVLVTAAKTLTDRMEAATRPPALMIAQHIWALSHGIALLFGRPMPERASGPQPEELLEAGVLIYLRGLGFVGGNAAPVLDHDRSTPSQGRETQPESFPLA